MTLPPAAAQVAAGKLKGIAVTTPAARGGAAEVPTTTEAGYPNVVVTVWNGFFVPAKTPKAIADKLGETILAVAAMPDVKARLAQLGFEPTSIAGEQFQRDVVTEAQDLGRDRGERGRHRWSGAVVGVPIHPRFRAIRKIATIHPDPTAMGDQSR